MSGSTRVSRYQKGKTKKVKTRRASLLPTDAVCCLRCLSWPPQAAHWPIRHINYDWPDSATVERVVNNGCDMVSKTHPLCRQDEWTSEHQFRLLFSRAEFVLINSWMPVQQIVYHMLRFFMKTEVANSGDSLKAASNYNIKTLMMWACELKSSSFWTRDLNLVRICVELLHTLSVWLNDVECPHYFIKNCNLLQNSFSVEMIAGQLLGSVDEAWLSMWFVNIYIQKCSMLCPNNVSSLFCDVITNMKLQNLVSDVVGWRLNTVLEDMWSVLQAAEVYIQHGASNFLTIQSCVCWMIEAEKTYTHLPTYFSAVTFLYLAYKIPQIGFTDELMDVLAAIAGQLISTHCHPSERSSELSLSKATKLMKVVANSSCSTMQLIEIELSKAYLYRALRCNDSDSNSIYCLANAYLAVLYYTTGEYQMAIDHCTLVMRSQDHSQCSSHVVQGELLPKIDDDIDNVLGLSVFYQ